jgi:hypothetical protein
MNVQFLLSPELDKTTILDFVNYEAGGINFGESMFALHPTLRNFSLYPEADKIEAIGKYVDTYYQTLAFELEEARKESEKDWRRIEKNFLQELTKFFPHVTLPNEPKAYLSIVDCNPRNIEDASFQFYWKHEMGANYVACHEIMHFYFFAYIKSIYPDTLGMLSTDTGKLWEMSELINDILLETPSFAALYPTKIDIHYPILTDKLVAAKELWSKGQYISIWAKEMEKQL